MTNVNIFDFKKDLDKKLEENRRETYTCKSCESKDVLLWQSTSRGINFDGETVKTMWIDDLFYRCQECGAEWIR